MMRPGRGVILGVLGTVAVGLLAFAGFLIGTAGSGPTVGELPAPIVVQPDEPEEKASSIPTKPPAPVPAPAPVPPQPPPGPAPIPVPEPAPDGGGQVPPPPADDDDDDDGDDEGGGGDDGDD